MIFAKLENITTMHKTITNKEISMFNVLLVSLGIISIIYISYKLDYRHSNSATSHKHSVVYRTVKLDANLKNGHSLSDLSLDLKQIKISLNAVNNDLKLYTYSLANQTNLKTNQSNSVSGIKNKIVKQKQALSLASQQLADLDKLNQTQINNLTSSYNLISLNIKNADNMLADKGAMVSNQVNSLSSSVSNFAIELNLLKVLNDQQVCEGLLDQLVAKLKISVYQASLQGVSATNLQADVTTIKGDLSLATGLSNKTVNYVINNDTYSQLDNKKYMVIINTTNRDLEAAINASQIILHTLTL